MSQVSSSPPGIPKPGSGFATCCGKPTDVKDSRRTRHGIRRRRICHICQTRYTTMEVIVAGTEDEHMMLVSDMAMLTSLGPAERSAFRLLLESVYLRTPQP